MDSFPWAAGSAFWLGILTSISPCPLATNITAVSFVARKMGRWGEVWLSGFLYAVGRMIGYTVLAAVLVGGMLSISDVSFALQNGLNKALGPVLVLMGLMLWGALPIPSGGSGAWLRRLQDRAAGWGLGGSFLLGVLFALSFCPVSAAIFFGSLLPLSLAHHSRFLLPAVYGLGTAFPVAIFAVLIAAGARSLGIVFQRVERVEYLMRKTTALIFVAAGAYFISTYLL